MKHSSKKILSGVIAVLLTIAVFTSCADADNTLNVSGSTNAAEKENTVTDAEKDETVYVITSADGSPEQIIVSDHIINKAGLDTVNDVSSLTDIKNVKGDEAFTRGDDGSVIWNAGGSDIYYQGYSDQALPVDMKISYRLNGKTVGADEIAGKSGHVTVCFDYTNNKYETIDINGKQEKIFVPFICATGIILNSEENSNVSVSNGKVINDGQRTVVMGISMPGLKESLGSAAEDFDIPSSAEISFDTDCFSLGLTATLVSAGISDITDMTGVTEQLDAGEIGDAVNEMDDAMTKLIDGSAGLYDGLYTLLSESAGLEDAVNTIYDGSSAIKNGASRLKDASAAVSNGASSLAAGLKELENSSDALTGGAETVFDTLLSAAETQLKAAGFDVTLTISNYDAVLDGIIASLDEENVYAVIYSEVSASVESQADAIYRQYIENNAKAVYDAYILTIADQVYAKYISDNADDYYYLAAYNSILEQLIQQGMTEEEARAYLDTPDGQQQIQTAVNSMDEAAKSAVRQAALDGLTDDQKALIREAAAAALSDDQKALIREAAVQNLTDEQKTAIINGAIAKIMESDEVKAKMAEASSGLQQVVSLKNSIDSYNAFYQGLIAYTGGVSQAVTGANALYDGASALSSGASSLYDSLSSLNTGLGTLKGSVPQLIKGVGQLTAGSMQISDGLNKFYDEGILELKESADGKLIPLIDRLKAVNEVADNYINFSGISPDMNGSVKFIYRSAAVE